MGTDIFNKKIGSRGEANLKVRNPISNLDFSSSSLSLATCPLSLQFAVNLATYA